MLRLPRRPGVFLFSLYYAMSSAGDDDAALSVILPKGNHRRGNENNHTHRRNIAAWLAKHGGESIAALCRVYIKALRRATNHAAEIGAFCLFSPLPPPPYPKKKKNLCNERTSTIAKLYCFHCGNLELEIFSDLWTNVYDSASFCCKRRSPKFLCNIPRLPSFV